MTTKKRNGKIDLFRFVFTMTIVIFHSNRFAVDLAHTWFPRGTMGVDFFFILTGFLFGTSILSKPDEGLSGMALCQDTYRFMGRKIKSIFPDFAVAFIVAFIAMCFYWESETFLERVDMFVETIPEFTFLAMAGFPVTAVDGVDWYLSAMFIGLFLMYPIARRKPKYFLYIIAPAAALLLIGKVFMMYGRFNVVKSTYESDKWRAFLYPGMFRAIGGMCFGAWLVLPSRKIGGLSLSREGKALCTLIEAACYLLTLQIMYTAAGKELYDLVIVLLFGIGIMLSFAHQGLLADLCDNAFFTALGKLSLDFYLCNLFWRNLIYHHLDGKTVGYRRLMLQYLFLVAATALTVRLISLGIRKISPGFRQACGKLFKKQTVS